MQAILLFGGISDERLVSVATSQNLATRFPFAELWFIDAEGRVSLTDNSELTSHERAFEVLFKPQAAPFASSLSEAHARIGERVVFLGLHGTEGEDGSLQALFEKSGVAYTGSDSGASHLCFEKQRAKRAVESHGVALAPEIILQSHEGAGQLKEKLAAFIGTHHKIAVKPVASGSSFGLHVLTAKSDLDAVANELAHSKYDRYLAEAFIEGRELTVGVTDDEARGLIALPASEVVLTGGPKFDYAGKYLGQGTKEITPAGINSAEMQSVQQMALQAHRALGCYGYSRTDMILTPQGPVFLETNTLPGMTKASFFPQQLEAANMSFTDFIQRQLELAALRAKRGPRR